MKESIQPVLETRQLIFGFIIALVVGVGLTVLVILPAEKGQDPSGFGELSGLDRLAQQEIENGAAPGSTVTIDPQALYISIDPLTTKALVNEFGEALPAVDGLNIRRHDSAYKTDTIEIEIDADGQVEYKAIMQAGEVLLYSWQADGEMYYDFHAHQAKAGPKFFTRYAEGEARSDQGSIVAPYEGQHGWFWLNIAGKPVSVKLTVAGYYDELVEIDMGSEEG